jgi:hypothetical protein
MVGHGTDFLRAHKDRTGSAGAALPAALAGETQSLVEKIGAIVKHLMKIPSLSRAEADVPANALGYRFLNKCPSINGQFARYLCCAKNLILGISTICLRLNFSRALISTKFAYFWMDTNKVRGNAQ